MDAAGEPVFRLAMISDLFQRDCPPVPVPTIVVLELGLNTLLGAIGLGLIMVVDLGLVSI